MTESLLLATTNKGKLREMQAFFDELPLKIFDLETLSSPSSFKETGSTFLANAEGKGLYYSRLWTGMTLGEDSGLVVDALDGSPGVYSARYAGPRASDLENIQKLLRMLQGIPPEKRSARFVSAMVLASKGDILIRIEESVEGLILLEKRGRAGFGYDPVFFYPSLNKAFAELSAPVKNSISHRGKALRKLKAFLSDLL